MKELVGMDQRVCLQTTVFTSVIRLVFEEHRGCDKLPVKSLLSHILFCEGFATNRIEILSDIVYLRETKKPVYCSGTKIIFKITQHFYSKIKSLGSNLKTWHGVFGLYYGNMLNICYPLSTLIFEFYNIVLVYFSPTSRTLLSNIQYLF